ncbi:hypothetical protein ACSRUE_03405 [Sorangium sp. KYC3313]|uniref:hypothetical protein n=1 Tax=Sorangium sp. KYC3313 TaxID=3449740 RepID=UPI003F8A1F63
MMTLLAGLLHSTPDHTMKVEPKVVAGFGRFDPAGPSLASLLGFSPVRNLLFGAREVVLAYAWGDLATDLMLPFWALPLLAVARVEELLGLPLLAFVVYAPGHHGVPIPPLSPPAPEHRLGVMRLQAQCVPTCANGRQPYLYGIAHEMSRHVECFS